MTEHVLVFGIGHDIPARMHTVGEASGQAVATSVMCWPQHLSKLQEAGQHARVIAMPSEASTADWIAFARTVNDMQPVTRIGSFHDDCRPQAAAVARDLGLAMHAPETVELVVDKFAMRQRLRLRGVEATACTVAGSPEELLAFAAEHGYPCVVKPVRGEASEGVSVLHEAAAAKSAFSRARGARDARVAIEEFLTGNQYSVESFSEQGEHVVVMVTRKYSDSASLVELGHVMPAPLEPEQLAAITQHVVATLDALEVEFGPTHTEVILTAKGPRIIETHLRAGGDEIWNMVTDVTGLDLIEAQWRQILGEKVLPGIRATLNSPERRRRCEAIWYAGAPSTGTLIEIDGADDERPENVTLQVLGWRGTECSGLQNSRSRMARARAHAATAQEAMDLAREAINGLTFVTRIPAAHPDLV